jgi:isopenicillin N synthase-like dioxygenase
MLQNRLLRWPKLERQWYLRKHNITQASLGAARLVHTESLLANHNFQKSNALLGASTVPPGYSASVGQLQTFTLPNTVTGTDSDRELGRRMVNTWRSDGIFQISISFQESDVLDEAYRDSKAFFQRPHEFKAGLVDPQSFSGYIASGEELTDGVADFSEIFTVTKDLPSTDRRVKLGWPCHGPCPWPSKRYETTMKDLMHQFGKCGEKLLQLVALGLGIRNENFFSDLTDDGWHHMRVLR